MLQLSDQISLFPMLAGGSASLVCFDHTMLVDGTGYPLPDLRRLVDPTGELKPASPLSVLVGNLRTEVLEALD